MPLVQKLQEELKGRENVLILAHNTGVDSKEFIAQWFRDSGFTFTPVVDAGEKGANVKAIGARYMPCNLVVGPDGRVQYASVGYDEAVIRRLLGLSHEG